MAAVSAAAKPSNVSDLRRRITKRKAALFNERASWLPIWQELADNLSPASGVLTNLTGKPQDGRTRAKEILDSTPIYALRVSTAGLHAGLSSPSQQWFQLSHPDESLMDLRAVREWVDLAERQLLRVFNASNVYKVLPWMYHQLLVYGTAVVLLESNYDTVINLIPIPIGQYALGTNHLDEVDTVVREFEMTVGQLVAKFGIDAVSPTVKTAFENDNLHHKARVIHMIEPRHGGVAGDVGTKKPWRSVYLEEGGGAEGVLQESGFDSFPVLAARWGIDSTTPYGVGPGSEVLGDVKGLYHKHRRLAQAIDYQTKPPLQAPNSLKFNEINAQPGGTTMVDPFGDQGIRKLFDVNLDLAHLDASIIDTRQRIQEGLYTNLFNLFMQENRQGVTAAEITERAGEKLIQIGPMLESVWSLLSTLVNWTFVVAQNAGVFPEPPPELLGADLSVKFVSPLSQVQETSAGLTAVNRFMAFVGGIAGLSPQVMDNIDVDAMVRTYGRGIGTPANTLKDIKQRDMERQKAAQATQAAMALQAAQSVAQTAQTASKAVSSDGTNGLDMIRQVAGN